MFVTTVNASGSEICLVMFSFCTVQFVCIHVLFGLYGVAATSVVRLYDLVLVSVASPFCRSDVVPVVICYSHQILPCRIACIPVRACAFDTARPRSAPR